MRTLVTAVAAAALVASAATVTLAQNAQTETNPNTKVYAYQKNTAPKKTTPGASVSMAGSQNSASEHLPAAVPFGSPKWWDIMGRQTTNGEGGQ
jgi:hypothetical protein